jgi:putative copper resistance protein D
MPSADFSRVGVASVALICSGIVNAWIRVGSFRALLVTDYGQLLLLKLAVFAAMVAFATINRLGWSQLCTAAAWAKREDRNQQRLHKLLFSQMTLF